MIFAFTMPEQKSTFAPDVDNVFNLINAVSLISFILVIGLMLLFVIKYRRKSEDEVTPEITHHTGLEIAWSIIPLIIVMFMFYWGYKSYIHMTVMPGNAIQINAEAKKWGWNFTYLENDGTITNKDDLVVPINVPIQINLTTIEEEAVLHSFFVPDFRVKQDVIPKQYRKIWFQATKLGSSRYYCTEYCGKNHWDMKGYIRVVKQDEYDKYVKGLVWNWEEKTPAENGKRLYKLNCQACHTIDGSVGAGPTWKGLFGRKGREVTIKGAAKIVNVDEAYIAESIKIPSAKLAKGFEGVPMTAFPNLTDTQIKYIIEYMKTIGKDK